MTKEAHSAINSILDGIFEETRISLKNRSRALLRIGITARFHLSDSTLNQSEKADILRKSVVLSEKLLALIEDKQ